MVTGCKSLSSLFRGKPTGRRVEDAPPGDAPNGAAPRAAHAAPLLPLAMDDPAGAEEGLERERRQEPRDWDGVAAQNAEEPRPQGSQEDLPTEPLEMSEADAAEAAAAERAARQEAQLEPARRKLREAVSSRVSKGTRGVYGPYQELWRVRPALGTQPVGNILFAQVVAPVGRLLAMHKCLLLSKKMTIINLYLFVH